MKVSKNYLEWAREDFEKAIRLLDTIIENDCGSDLLVATRNTIRSQLDLLGNDNHQWFKGY